jgi:hypothetical protein
MMAASVSYLLRNVIGWCLLLLMSGLPASSGVHVMQISNETIAGTDIGCKHITTYIVNSIVNAPMCIGQTDQDLKNGMSIINVITSRFDHRT